MIEIKEYDNSLQKDLFEFRRQVLLEGNDSLKSDKFNPEDLDGKIWSSMLFLSCVLSYRS